VIPKPLQKPHPPLWVACSRRETIHLAARRGIGALTFSFVEPEDAGKWAREYYELIASEECVPAGFAVNPVVTIVLPMMCHGDEATAIERGIDGAHFFGYSLAYYYGFGRHHPGRDVVWDSFQRERGERGFAREIVTADAAPLGVQIMQQGVGSLRGAIGTPAQITELARRYEAAGVDQIVFVQQAGRNRHEHICESLELFGAEVLPAFAEEAEAKEREKAERLAPAVEAALARRDPPRAAPADYVVDEGADLARSRPRRAAVARPRRAEIGRRARRVLEQRGQAALARSVRGASDRKLERRFGNRLVQRGMFTGMARRFRPISGYAFEGDVLYVLDHAVDGAAPREPARWTIRIRDGKAKAIEGDSPDPAVTLRVSIPDFARIAAEEVRPPELFFSGRLSVEGNFEIASRLPEMFGAPSPF
jgi:Luciferase-like monooxygenase/SCP-2 sterol transfer family